MFPELQLCKCVWNSTWISAPVIGTLLSDIWTKRDLGFSLRLGQKLQNAIPCLGCRLRAKSVLQRSVVYESVCPFLSELEEKYAFRLDISFLNAKSFICKHEEGEYFLKLLLSVLWSGSTLVRVTLSEL